MNKRTNFFKSINFKIALVFAMLLVVTLEVVGVIFVRQLETQNLNQFKTQVQLQPYVENEISTQLERANTKSANSQISDIIGNINNQNITEIRVIDAKGVIRGTSNSTNQSIVGQKTTDRNVKDVIYNTRTYQQVSYNKTTNTRYFVSIVPLINTAGATNNLTGVVYIRANLESVYQNVNNITLIFVVAALIAITIGLILAVLISRAITRPIEEMRQRTIQIARGDYSGQVQIYGDDELGQLAEAVNELSVRVEESQESTESERRRLDSVLGYMTDGVLATDRRGRITIVNEMATDFLNLENDQIVGKSILDILDLRGTFTLRDLLENQEQVVLDLSDDDQDLILHASFALIQRESGFISGLVCVLHDVTEQQKIDQDRKRFVSNVSHELRTPLTSMKSYIEALVEGAWKDPEVAPNFLKVTQEETDRMMRMINDLLNLSRMDLGTARLEREYVNLNELFNHILDRFDMILKNSDKPDKNYSIKRDFTRRDIWVEVDTDKIQQVLDNIMNNAIKYSPDGGIITCRLLETHNHVIMSITDQGLGIPKDSISHIFDRFYRVDKARSRAQGGTGLGLAISKEVIQLHGGRIWVESREGEGSTFYISLPYEPFEEGDTWE
ncbi:cell wall metabolism sensor histidine kinase WalK [Pediococcus pentosaceus]|jgi:two-component system sensor histidine kinase VicK|uniref:cell wall metabolism sensor histidine kinase WalK n=1 Tax=Pediococcus pentosaceus TaxID=1255 RepID=UPI0002F841E4|nr:cell wall metabolism sensor histidine kinase WalK [Pediococcus pentosaceus]MBM9929585.1 cell wall metabolism sensor histidine kinase WalK [Pediococcus pentosaceus]MCE5959736.1 cell wall metabolism sensor histidine kinase WalK [Pediococcus pentosaceus]MCG7197236.1 cell wall metabolism sensor histidine kinase WalK [Pediococcus pentosaceus]MCI2396908.1 cell wall metabolism sensor histidine kinase WalK [Pediococcus pentosaceus]MCS8564069.1 cell wall metabolism sensor histidine kinase WalK [Pedi